MTDLAMRFRVLERDGFRCRYCGAAATDEFVRLEVDHVLPLARGGKDNESNLVAACRNCNLGKSARVIDPRLIGIEIVP